MNSKLAELFQKKITEKSRETTYTTEYYGIIKEMQLFFFP